MRHIQSERQKPWCSAHSLFFEILLEFLKETFGRLLVAGIEGLHNRLHLVRDGFLSVSDLLLQIWVGVQNGFAIQGLDVLHSFLQSE